MWIYVFKTLGFIMWLSDKILYYIILYYIFLLSAYNTAGLGRITVVLCEITKQPPTNGNYWDRKDQVFQLILLKMPCSPHYYDPVENVLCVTLVERRRTQVLGSLKDVKWRNWIGFAICTVHMFVNLF